MLNQFQPFNQSQRAYAPMQGGMFPMRQMFTGNAFAAPPKKPQLVDVPNEMKFERPDVSKLSPRVQKAMLNAYNLQQGVAGYQNQQRASAMAENAARQEQYNKAMADYRNQQQAVQQYYRMMQMHPQQRQQYQMMLAQQQQPMLPGRQQQQQQSQPNK